MPQRSVATNYTFEQQRTEINLLAADFWTHKTTVDGAATSYLKHDGSNDFTGGTLAVPNAFTINANSGAGTLTISGNLNVTGTTTTVNTTNLDVTDKNITIAKGNTSDATADGAGITIDSGTDITWNFVDANDAWVSSIGVEATTFLKGPYGQFTGSGTPTTGQGVEVNAPDANTGQISSYDRGNSAYKDLRIKGAGIDFYAGSTNAIVGGFHNSGLIMQSGKNIAAQTLTSTGDVSLGHTSPTARLDVRRGDADGLIAEFHQNTGYGIDIGSSVSDAYISSGYNQNFIIKTDPSSGQVERLRIAANGDVTLGYQGNSLYFQNGFNDSSARIQNAGSSNNSNLRFLTRSSGTEAERLRIASDGTISKYHNATDIAAAFGGGGQVNGVTALPSMAGVPFVVAKDTGSLRSATFAGLVETGALIVKGDNSATSRFQVQTTNSSPDLRLHTWNDANGMYALLGVNDYLNASGNNADATADKKSAGVFIDGRSGKIELRTKHDSGTSPSARLTITSSGYVTITDTPTLLIKNTSTVGNGVGGITIGKDYAGTDGCIQINSINSGSDTDHLGIEFKVHPSGSGSAQPDRKMVLDHTGKLVIGEIESTFYGQTPDSGQGAQLTLVGNADGGRPGTINLFGFGNTSNEAHARINFQQQTTGTNGQTTARIEAINRSGAEDASDLAFYTEKASSDLKKSLMLTNKGEALLYKNASDASIGTATNLSFDSLYLGIGESEGGINVYRTIGFGYRSNTTSEYPASIGCQITDWSQNTKAELVFATRNTTGQADVATERLRIESGGTIRTLYGVQSGGNGTGGFKFTSNYSGKGFDIATQYATQGNGGSGGGDPMFSGWWGQNNTLRINTDGQIKARTLELQSPDTDAQFAKYHVLTGAKQVNGNGTTNELFKIGHSAMGRLQVYTLHGKDDYSSGMRSRVYDIQLIYGNPSLQEESSHSSMAVDGTLTDITVAYNNSNGSTDYIITSAVSWNATGAHTSTTPWVYWTWEGTNSIRPSNI